jgi:hypothetical protein
MDRRSQAPLITSLTRRSSGSRPERHLDPAVDTAVLTGRVICDNHTSRNFGCLTAAAGDGASGGEPERSLSVPVGYAGDRLERELRRQVLEPGDRTDQQGQVAPLKRSVGVSLATRPTTARRHARTGPGPSGRSVAGCAERRPGRLGRGVAAAVGKWRNLASLRGRPDRTVRT